MATLQQFKCPRCGGALSFDPGQQEVKCPYCDTVFPMQSLLAYDQGLDQMQEDQLITELDAENVWTEEEVKDMYVYVCQSCGGEIIGDATTAATKCPYCDNPVVIKEKFAGDLKPDLVIPFKLDKEAAKKRLEEHVRSRKLVPAVFRDRKHIDEIKGVYVPVWLYDTDARADIVYRGETVNTWRDRDYEYIQTNYYALQRSGYITFDSVPVDGSAKMDDQIMQSLEPFDVSQAVDFQTAYLAGYLADRYDANADEQLEIANDRIRNTVANAFLQTTAGYSMVTTERSSVRLENLKAKYALYPVWLLNTSWEGKNYLFAMNGQTGKFIGDLPADKALSWKYFFRVFGGVTVAMLAARLLSMLMGG